MKCDCGKKLLASVAVFVFKMVSGIVLCGGVFKWVYELMPTDVWRPVMPSKRLFLGLFLASLLFVIGYKILGCALTGMGKAKKGLVYGFTIWLAGIVPGMIMTYITMTVNSTVILYWTVMLFVLTPVQGVIVAMIMGDDSSESCCCVKKP
ncbi:MAG: hypothetical protein V2A70_09350 [Candidatus Omnitrophota bacterium]